MMMQPHAQPPPQQPPLPSAGRPQAPRCSDAAAGRAWRLIELLPAACGFQRGGVLAVLLPCAFRRKKRRRTTRLAQQQGSPRLRIAPTAPVMSMHVCARGRSRCARDYKSGPERTARDRIRLDCLLWAGFSCFGRFLFDSIGLDAFMHAFNQSISVCLGGGCFPPRTYTHSFNQLNSICMLLCALPAAVAN